MKKFSLLTFIAFTSFAFGQKIDLTKIQANQNFYKSENRKAVQVPTSDFEIFYKIAKCVKKNYDIKFSEMPIFQVKKTDEFIENGRFRQSLFGLGDTIFPKYQDNGKKTVTCGAFPTGG